MNKKLASLFFALIFSASTGLPGILNAASSVATVLPEKMYVSGQPGQKVLKKFTVSNRLAVPVTYKLTTKNFKLKNETGQLEFYAGDSGMANWIIPQYVQIGLTAAQSKEVSFVIDIPADAASRGYQGTILLEPTAVNSKPVAGVLILLNVGQNSIVAPKLMDSTISRINDSFPISLSMTLKNPGDQNLRTNGTMTLKDWRNRTVEEIKDQKIFILSNSTQKFTWNMTKPTAMFGFYRAQIQLDNPTNPNSKITSSSWFVVFPWKGSLWFLSGILIVFLMFELGRRLALKKP